MVAITTGRGPRYTQSLHRAHTAARAPSSAPWSPLNTGRAPLWAGGLGVGGTVGRLTCLTQRPAKSYWIANHSKAHDVQRSGGMKHDANWCEN